MVTNQTVKMSLDASWVHGKNKCNNANVYSLCWTFLGCLYPLHKSEGLGTETLGLALLLSPDPGGTVGLSLTPECG